MNTKPVSWRIIYLYPNYEKKVYSELTKRKIECYLPLFTVKKKWSDRIKLLEKPLFPNYLFVRPPETGKHELLNIAGVVKYVMFDGKTALVADAEIAHLQSLLAIQQRLQKDPKPVIEGKSIVVLEGSLKAIQNHVIKRLNESFLEIVFESLDNIVTIHVQKNRIVITPVAT